MINNILKNVFSQFAGGSNGSPEGAFNPKKVEYVHFEVVDEDLAGWLYDWHQQSVDAHKIVEQYVNKTLNRGLCRSNFEYDLDGRLERMSFSGAMPKGWRGGRDGKGVSAWMYPESFEAQRGRDALPLLGSRLKLHAKINWPTLDERLYQGKEKSIARFANRCIIPYGDGEGRTFLKIPKPPSFAVVPRIETMMEEWYYHHTPKALRNPYLDDDQNNSPEI